MWTRDKHHWLLLSADMPYYERNPPPRKPRGKVSVTSRAPDAE